MKHLFIDETLSDDYFIVGGVVFESDEIVINTYKKFKNIANNRCSGTKDSVKNILFQEFKSSQMDRRFPSLKKEMLKLLAEESLMIIYTKRIIHQPLL